MTARSVPPWLYVFLLVPFGAAGGYPAVVLGKLLSKGGVGPGELSVFLALTTLPHTFKFLWSPILDVTLTPKIWYVLATLATSVCIALFGAFPARESSLGVLSMLLVVSGFTSATVGMAADSLVAHTTSDHDKGRASGWFQAGSIGLGGGIGAGLGLAMAVRVDEHWKASTTIAVLCALCCLVLLFLPSPAPVPPGQRAVALVKATLRDLWQTIRVRRGLLALLLCFLPLGLAASSSLWSALSVEWDTSEDTVAFYTGVLGGGVSAAGCLAAGWMCDRWHRQRAYVVFGLCVSVAGVLMAVLPRTPVMFVTTTLLIQFCTGMSWAGYSAFVLEAIGRGAAATKFTAYASLANMPIYYMGHVNGWAINRWGTNGMLFFEAALGVAAAVAFIIAAKCLLPARRAVPPPVPPGV